MNARTCYKLGLALLAAALAGASGCAPFRPFRDPVSPTPPPQYRSTEPQTEPAAAEPVPGGRVVAASGWEQPPMPPPRPPHQPQPYPLPQPQPYPVHQYPPTPSAPPVFADPRLRSNPTVLGGTLELGPNEVPLDRVVALTKHIEAVLAQNAHLNARIKELEALAVGREQALAEAEREVAAVTADAAKARTALQTQLAVLQAQLKKYEDDDIQFLEAALKLLKKIAEQQGGKP